MHPTTVAVDLAKNVFELAVAQRHRHQVTLLPAQYVRPYARGNKADRTDADALLEAVRSGRIVPVAIKTVAQQELLAVHRIRDQWMATRTARINALRGFLREQGILLPRGAHAAVAGKPLTRLQQWTVAVAHRRGHNKATIALANTLARIVWAVWRFDVTFAVAPALAA